MADDFTSPDAILALLNKYGTGFREKDDIFFTEGNFYLKKFIRLGVLSDTDRLNDDAEKQERTEIICNVPNCCYSCSLVQDYESHYNSQHRYTCGECKKTLPSGHLLDLHLSETHDSYFAAQVQSGKRPMYDCFLEECPHKSRDSLERRDHCIKEHKFPHNFRFDKQIPTQKKSKPHSSYSETIVNSTEMDVEPVDTGSSSSAAKCTKNFNFGHSKVRSFKPQKLDKKTDILESNRMVVDLLESLPKD
ncbi:protein lethal(2)k10201 [Topomyia yanbarensis]|uniref:protein lethal(2)k10201 n=1 Tax=Topomyia yanbarensis TaxID=2498891 RepID=UPI00273C2064|nr:protein lethal(2)k10201 [Topomyia yanbarensis]